jgi:hypothetical protein
MEEIKDFVLKKAESRVCKLYEIWNNAKGLKNSRVQTGKFWKSWIFTAALISYKFSYEIIRNFKQNQEAG